jgi:hypothetical protein
MILGLGVHDIRTGGWGSGLGGLDWGSGLGVRIGGLDWGSVVLGLYMVLEQYH